jgi:hypothetical protein
MDDGSADGWPAGLRSRSARVRWASRRSKGIRNTQHADFTRSIMFAASDITLITLPQEDIQFARGSMSTLAWIYRENHSGFIDPVFLHG